MALKDGKDYLSTNGGVIVGLVASNDEKDILQQFMICCATNNTYNSSKNKYGVLRALLYLIELLLYQLCIFAGRPR